jgi:hypothetical protein
MTSILEEPACQVRRSMFDHPYHITGRAERVPPTHVSPILT